MQLLAIVGNYGPRWRQPVFLHGPAESVIFCDHRDTPSTRAQAIAEVFPAREVNFDVFIAAYPDGGCDDGCHRWKPHTVDDVIDSATCSRCGRVDTFEPIRAPRHVRRFSAAS